MKISIVNGRVVEVANYTKSDEVKSSGTKTAGTLSTSTRYVMQFVYTAKWITFSNYSGENSLPREVSIWRGCQSLVPEKMTQNSLSYSVHNYFCAKDLCNHGDGSNDETLALY